MADVGALFRAHERELVAIAWRMLRDADEARDVAQEAFARLLAAERAGTEVRHPRAWLIRTAVHFALRRMRRRPSPPPAEIVREPHSGDAERRALLDQALAALPDRQRVVFILRHGQGMRLNEIAETLGVAPSTAGVHLTRALRALRESLAPHFEERP